MRDREREEQGTHLKLLQNIPIPIRRFSNHLLVPVCARNTVSMAMTLAAAVLGRLIERRSGARCFGRGVRVCHAECRKPVRVSLRWWVMASCRPRLPFRP